LAHSRANKTQKNCDFLFFIRIGFFYFPLAYFLSILLHRFFAHIFIHSIQCNDQCEFGGGFRAFGPAIGLLAAVLPFSPFRYQFTQIFLIKKWKVEKKSHFGEGKNGQKCEFCREFAMRAFIYLIFVGNLSDDDEG
jgi:hypothetical protein